MLESVPIALQFMYYKVRRPHEILKNLGQRTPVTAAGLDEFIWTTKELLSLRDRPN